MGKMVNTYRELKNEIDHLNNCTPVVELIKTTMNLYGVKFMNNSLCVWELFDAIFEDYELDKYNCFYDKTCNLNQAYIYMKLALWYLHQTFVLD